MSNRSQTTHAIRVGLIYDDAVIDERIVDSPRPVSVGTELGATLSVDAPDLPRQIALVDWHDGGYVLRAFPEMTGRVRTDHGVEALEEAAFGCDTGGDGAALIPLTEISEGRIAFGDAVVLIQRVSPTSEPQRPALPDELKWSLRAGLDARLAGTLAAVALLQIGFVAWTQFHSWPEPTEPLVRSGSRGFVSVDDIPEPTPDDPPKPPVDPTAAPEKPDEGTPGEPEEPTEAPEQVADNDTPAGDSTPDDATPADETPPADRRNMATASASDGTVLEALGSKDGEELLAKMETASPTGEMDEAIADAKHSGDDGDERMLETGGRDNPDETGRAVGSDGPLEKTSGARQAEEGISTGSGPGGVRVSCPDCDDDPRTPPDDGPAPTPGIGDVIERHAGRIQQCYERELKQDPGMSGKIVVSFRIDTNGSAVGLRATRDSVGGAVADCVLGVFRQMPFPSQDARTSTIDKTFVFEPAT